MVWSAFVKVDKTKGLSTSVSCLGQWLIPDGLAK